MTEDQYNLKDKSDSELSEWLRKQKPGTNEYIAGEREILRRVAVIEELIERVDCLVIYGKVVAFC